MIVTSLTFLRLLRLIQGIIYNAVAITVLCFGLYGQTVQPKMQDWFGRISNDDLQARVQTFQSELTIDGAAGLAVLHGPGLVPYFNQRRNIGCSRFLKWPEGMIQFRFANDQNGTRVEFWKIPKGFISTEFRPNVPDYRLNLGKPIEMTVSMATDEFCPTYFELNWYAKFLVANPTLKAAQSLTSEAETSLSVV
jgi:hypothetical protein